MFTIEHEFDSTVVTLVDEGAAPLQEDVTISLDAVGVTFRQYDVGSDDVRVITLSNDQLADLIAALNLPEGSYVRRPTDVRPGDSTSGKG